MQYIKPVEFSQKQKNTKVYKFFKSLEYGEYCNNWENFEKYIYDKFQEYNFLMVVGIKNCDDNLKNYLELKKPEIKDNLTIINEKGNLFQDIVIYQPYGSTQSPDFLFITPKYIVPIECKVSRKNSPKWNSLPGQDTLIFFASTKAKILTYFWGYQVLDTHAREELDAIKTKLDTLFKDEYNKSKHLKGSNLKIYWNFSDFTDSNNYISNEYNQVRQDTIIRLFTNDY